MVRTRARVTDDPAPRAGVARGWGRGRGKGTSRGCGRARAIARAPIRAVVEDLPVAPIG